MESIVFVAPIERINGQSRVSRYALDSFSKNGYNCKVIDTSYKKSYIYNLARIILYSFFRRYRLVYFTPSRTYLGSIRDFILLIVFRGRVIVGHLHGADFRSFLSKPGVYTSILSRLYLDNLTKMIVLSRSHAEYSSLKGLNNVIIKNPMPDLTEKIDKRKAITNTQDKLSFLFVSVPLKAKGLLKSFEYLKRELRDEFQLIALGWNRQDFIDIYKKEPPSSIDFRGFVSGEERFDFYRNADFMIFLTEYKAETQPMVFLEAAACGLKVIFNPIRSLKDFLQYDGFYSFQNLNGNQIYQLADLEIFDERLIVDFSSHVFEKKLLKCFE